MKYDLKGHYYVMVRCCGLSLSLVKGKTESTVVKIRYNKGKAINL